MKKRNWEVTRQFCVVLATVVILFHLSSAIAQEQGSLEIVDRSNIDKQFSQEISELATWCHENQHDDWARQTLETLIVRDPNRMYIFLPTESAGESTATSTDLEQEWRTRLSEVKKRHTGRLIEWTEQSLRDGEVEDGVGAKAFQTLHECLHWDPENDRIRTALGHRKTDDGWQPYSERLKVKTSTRTQPITGWPKGSYLQVTTDNFIISSQADEQTTTHLAEQLQRWQWVWRQVFFDYWGSPKNLKRWMDGTSQSRGQTRKFEVIFFASKQDYAESLAPRIPGIEVSSGYYSDQFAASFFYASDDSTIEETWRHELTHQLFKESVATDKEPFAEGFLWLGEGIAEYMESLKDFGDFVTLGGFDSRRLQFARARQFREAFQIPLQELNDMSLKEFQTHPDIKRIYSQTAGLSHFLMDGENGARRSPTIELLELIYRGRFKPDKFAEVMGASTQELDTGYASFLKVPSDEVSQFLLSPDSVIELYLPMSPLELDAFESIGRCRNLESLDISGSELTSERIRAIAACAQLDQIFAVGSNVAAGTVRQLGQFENLRSLDMTLAKFDREAILEFDSLDGISQLALAYSNINDNAIPHLTKLKNLQSLNISKTQISEAGKTTLRNALPKLKLID
ncbi:MAG: hypothetical protein R3C03_17500 [Pirellulaceae bacterium]